MKGWLGGEHTTFVNYVYGIALLELIAEDDPITWGWISARRDSRAQALGLAPRAWREWVRQGSSALPRLRRRVARANVTKVRDQRPRPESPGAADLEVIYKYFDRRN